MSISEKMIRSLLEMEPEERNELLWDEITPIGVRMEVLRILGEKDREQKNT